MKVLLGRIPGKASRPRQSLHTVVILFIPLLTVEGKSGIDWAATNMDCIPRQCPECLSDSVVGHGRRRKQAHDEAHDWIGIRRGLCNRCQKTITFLPLFSLPYTHYSLVARSQALQRYFVDGCSLDVAAPLVKDPDRIPVASTLRRWFSSRFRGEMDRPQQFRPPASFTPPCEATVPLRPATVFPLLAKMINVVSHWLAHGDMVAYG